MGVGRSTVSVHVFAVDCQRACVGRGIAVSAVPVSVSGYESMWSSLLVDLFVCTLARALYCLGSGVCASVLDVGFALVVLP